ncbi:MAG: hypothetical protein CW338_01650 [Clostridiales bacterium]|nr:hypothetical protein [Clostridiales bacterium]
MRAAAYAVHDYANRYIYIRAHTARGRHPFLRGVYRTLNVPAGRIIVKGLLKRTDPRIPAPACTAPVTALIRLCGRKPEKEKEALENTGKCVEQFIEAYRA